MDNNKVKVSIFGQTYTINGDAPGEYIMQLADYIDTKMQEINANNSNYNATQIAILAALNIADEYFQLKEMKVGLEGFMEQKATALISMLDEGLVGDIFPRFGSLSR